MYKALYKNIVFNKQLRKAVFRRAKKLVAIVIPVYKEKMSYYENIGFCRCLKVLNQYNIVLVVPEALNVEEYIEIANRYNYKINIVRFPGCYFEGIAGYNQLMLWDGFYEQFLDYKYVLIYQLDCYVFKDELYYWCSQNYDYIGAPWMGELSQAGLYDYLKKNYASKDSFLKAFLRKHFSSTFEDIGNGGLSLRKVKKFMLILKLFKYQAKRWEYYEDLFFSTLVPNLDLFFSVPNKITAMKFSIESYPLTCFEMIGKTLPFGCHAWQKYDKEFWSDYIEVNQGAECK